MRNLVTGVIYFYTPHAGESAQVFSDTSSQLVLRYGTWPVKGGPDC